MTANTPMLALADRVERAECPSRELDAEIWATTESKGAPVWRVGPPTYEPARLFCNPCPDIDWIGYDLFQIAPHYTSSIDSAVLLVPTGNLWRWLLDRRAFASGRPDGYRAEVTLSGKIEPKDCQSWAATPALALCASALRARAAAAGGSDGNG